MSNEPIDSTPRLSGLFSDQHSTRTDAIVHSDREAFDEWISDPDNARRLDIPNGALRYIFIPEKILELVEDPSRIDVIVLYRSKVALRLFVVEHRDSPVTDRESLEKYRQNVARVEGDAAARTSESRSLHRIVYPGLPSGVDNYHASPEAEQLMEEGILSLSDYVINAFSLNVDSARDDFDCLIMGEYEDREEFRGKGVGKSFFGRLRETAKHMGFRFIEGMNNERNINFFIRVLGRSTLAQVKPELRDEFKPQSAGGKLEEITVDFLYPEDKEIFLI